MAFEQQNDETWLLKYPCLIVWIIVALCLLAINFAVQIQASAI